MSARIHDVSASVTVRDPCATQSCSRGGRGGDAGNKEAGINRSASHLDIVLSDGVDL